MSDKMQPISFSNLLNWMFTEYNIHETIFCIPKQKFFCEDNDTNLLGENISNPIGPAAGPHTQLTQNIVSAYLTGGRFFELKTVQKMDELEVDKPCIDARDECYNVEWSQELKLDQSYDEYVKAWMILHLLKSIFDKSDSQKRDFIFNMSVGYDLEGIKTPRMNRFIDEIIDASKNELFNEYKNKLTNFLSDKSIQEGLSKNFNLSDKNYEKIIDSIKNVPHEISNSVTLSTMHGCPPNEIEAISKYLIKEKGLHTYVKLNPTLLGFDTVSKFLSSLGYNYIDLKKESFDHDLQYSDAVPMLTRLKEFAKEHDKIFGVKLSNTLGVANRGLKLAGDDMYMSGRSLFPLTINLAYKLALEFKGVLNISYSGGATEYNTNEILETGIRPVTYATDLLKPGGYQRLFQISNKIADDYENLSGNGSGVDLKKLKLLADNALKDKYYSKEQREIDSIKVGSELDKFDCFISPCQEACPIHQDVSEYIRLVSEERFAEAFELIVSKNALPHITGYICDHQCMYHCTRWDYDEPVMIREIKKKAALEGYDEFVEKFKSEFEIRNNGIKTAVIGAGPSGLSASYFLSKAGFDVTVFEKEMRPGGIVQNILPGFRLPQEAIDKDIKFIEELGVRFVFGFDGNFSIERLKSEGFKYFYISTGAGKSNKINLESSTDNVIGAIDFLWDFKNKKESKIGKNVAVIGGGNSAMDSARAAMRCGNVKNVYIIYRRTKEFMPADKEEFYAALDDGVVFKDLLLPLKLDNGILTCQKMILDKIGEDGRKNVVPLKDQFEEIQIDTIISAIGEHVDIDILSKNKIKLKDKSAIVSGTNETSLENVFIGGDALRGPSTVVEAIADGRTAADSIIKKEGLQPLTAVSTKNYFDPVKRETDIILRKGSASSQNTDDIIAETSRCLDCNFICTKCVEVCPNRANITIDTSGYNDIFSDRYQILHLESSCNECGNCETFCPHNGSPFKDKITLFKNESEFKSSNNDGFYFVHNSTEENVGIMIRLSDKSSELMMDENGDIDRSSINGINTNNEFEMLAIIVKEVYKNYKYLWDESTV